MDSKHSVLFQYRGVPSASAAFPLALQHVVAMIVGCVTPAIIVSGTAGLSPADAVILIQAALVTSALATFVQLFPLIRTRYIALGSGLPVIMGISFAYVPSMQSIAERYNVGTMLGSMIVGGIVAIFVGLFIKKIRRFFPPLVTGTVVFTIGLSLYPTAVNYMAGGVGKPDYGSLKNWLVAILTLVIVTALNHFAKGILKLASILIGVTVGYIVCLCLGMVNFAPIAQASYFQLPMPLHFGIEFHASACVAIGLLFAINSIQAIGDFTATTSGGMDRHPTNSELQGGIVGYGVTNILFSLLGGLPTATYSQNVGIVATTKVINRLVLSGAAMIILIAGLIPKFSSLLTTIPPCVIGGATISVFASIAMTGMKLITTQPMTFRNTSVVGLAVALGMGVTQASGSIAAAPGWFVMIFGKSPVVLATLVAVALNLILPKGEEERKAEQIGMDAEEESDIEE